MFTPSAGFLLVVTMAYPYTSISRAKLAIGGKLPPMTPLGGSAKKILDSRFTIGLGALREDPARGLQCPVKGCGKWFHVLSRHLTSSHADIGGKVAVMDALEIPRMTRLVSASYAKMRADQWKQLDYDERCKPLLEAQARVRELRAMGLFKRFMPNKGMTTAGWRNHRDRCEAQMREPIQALADTLGRVPTMHEVGSGVSEAFMWHCISVYGSWASALKAMGFTAYKPGVSPTRKARASKEAVIAALRAYHDVHACLPLSVQARSPSRKPLIPCMETIMRAFHAESWKDAMESARIALGLPPLTRNGRYLRKIERSA